MMTYLARKLGKSKSISQENQFILIIFNLIYIVNIYTAIFM